jgi:hypothetical protein
VLAALGGCKRSSSNAAPIASGVPAPIASSIGLPPAEISKAVNPKGEAAYDGPTATVHGWVHIVGDPPPDEPEILAQIPEGCGKAREMYGKLFREGEGRLAADVLVAVTGYKGYVPARRQAVPVEATGCAFDTRTVGVTLGERIDVIAKDRRAYVPDLLGGNVKVQLIAMPGTDGTLYPNAPGRYLLIDSMRTFARAEVLVLKYSTFDVTRIDGKFKIENVPVGKVMVNAFSPMTFATAERELVLEAGQDVQVNFELRFDEKKYRSYIEAQLRAQAKTTSPAPPGATPSSAPSAASSAP